MVFIPENTWNIFILQRLASVEEDLVLTNASSLPKLWRHAEPPEDLTRAVDEDVVGDADAHGVEEVVAAVLHKLDELGVFGDAGSRLALPHVLDDPDVDRETSEREPTQDLQLGAFDVQAEHVYPAHVDRRQDRLQRHA